MKVRSVCALLCGDYDDGGDESAHESSDVGKDCSRHT